jgi:hypothetical protein
VTDRKLIELKRKMLVHCNPNNLDKYWKQPSCDQNLITEWSFNPSTELFEVTRINGAVERLSFLDLCHLSRFDLETLSTLFLGNKEVCEQVKAADSSLARMANIEDEQLAQIRQSIAAANLEKRKKLKEGQTEASTISSSQQPQQRERRTKRAADPVIQSSQLKKKTEASTTAGMSKPPTQTRAATKRKLVLMPDSEEEEEDPEPLKRKKSSHARTSTSEAQSSEPKSSNSPPKIIKWLVQPNSDYVEITREDGHVQQVQINAVLSSLSDEDLLQLLRVENQEGRSLVSHRALLLRVHGHFNTSDPTIQPIEPEPLKLVPLQVVAPTSIKTWGFMQFSKLITIERNNGSVQMLKPTELYTLSNQDVNEMLSIARDDPDASQEQKQIIGILNELLEKED